MKRTRRFCTLLLTIAAMLTAMAQEAGNYKPDKRNVQLDSTNLPIVFIEVNGTMIQKDDYITARMKVVNNGEGKMNYRDTVAHPGQQIDYDGYIALKYRGSSSFYNADKKPYTIRPIDKPLEENGKKQKVAFMGMPKDNNWALLSAYADKTLMRDLLSFILARPYMEYVPQGRYCEMLLDGMYYGVFIMCEKVTKGKYRLNLEEPGDEGDELTGDYLVEVDRSDEPGFRSDFSPYNNSGRPYKGYYTPYIKFAEPDGDEITTNQMAYIQQAFHDMEASFLTGNYAEFVDVTSMIDYQIATELAHNVDGYRLSTNLYKRRDSKDKRFKTSLWDLNLGWGNADYYYGSNTNTWIYQLNPTLYSRGDEQMVPFWWYVMNHDKTYIKALERRWTLCRYGGYSNERINAVIDSLALTLTCNDAVTRNYKAWPRLSTYVWPNYYVGGTYANEVAHLKQWASQRLQAMDRTLYKPVKGDVNGDGEVSVADITMLVSLVLAQKSNPRSDVNEDTETSIADISALVGILTNDSSTATVN